MAETPTVGLLLTAVFCLTQTAADGRLNQKYSSVIFPNRRPNAEYITQCGFDDGRAPFCGWTHLGWMRTQTGPAAFHLSQEDSPSNPFEVARLESSFLNLSEDSCMEFWYRRPALNGTNLVVLVKDGSGERELWTSPQGPNDSWQLVFVPLSFNEDPNTQVVFEATQDLFEDVRVSIDNVGVRLGRCGEQCHENSEFWVDDSCGTHCKCTSPGGHLECSSSSCREGQTCRAVEGAWGCHPSTLGTCTIHGSPFYSTFDGAKVHSANSCAVVLTRVCHESEGLPFFSVEVRKERPGNFWTSSSRHVTVELKSFRVSMLRKETQRVMVNGLWKRLPLTLNGEVVRIRQTEDSVLLETNFGLRVSFNTAEAVSVTVPTLYSSKLCGICGNFNHLIEDDYIQPHPDALEQSHQRGDGACESPLLPPLCLLEEEVEYKSQTKCGAILWREGPFAACSSVLSVESFFRSCVFDMCATHGDPKTFCSILQSYAEACKRAGLNLPIWRNSTFCPVECHEHSHYNACAAGCPATCSDQDTTRDCPSCEQRCECDPGYLLSGGSCVPQEDCGCWKNGQHYKKGATFMIGECESLCQCLGSGQVECSPAPCLEGEVCKEKDGAVGCFPSDTTTCRVFGDPHYITFDGKLFDYQGACNYTLVTTCADGPVWFRVTGRNRNHGDPTWSALDSVALEVPGLHIALRQKKRVYVNGILAELPVEQSGGVSVFLKGPYVQVDTDFGLRLLFDEEHRLFVHIGERHKGQVCGLCGTYSDSQYDDFLTPEGVPVANVEEFGNSWRVTDDEWICSPSPPAMPTCNPQVGLDGHRECSILYEAPFEPCHWFVPPQLYNAACHYDYCATLGDTRLLCASLESYAAACQVAEVDLGDWREKTVCANVFPTPPDVSTTTPSQANCPLDCNFDNGKCGWLQLITDSFDWIRQKGPTPSDLTGPSYDHTSGDGYYMYIEGDGKHHGDSARMLSPKCLEAGPHCLRFWYHMYGQSQAMALNLYLLQGISASKIWGKANNQGDMWLPAEVEINVPREFQIIIEGIRGSDWQSDVALDDVSIHYGECSGSSSTGRVTSPTPVCMLQCSFDKDLCAWSQEQTDSFDWTRLNGSTPTSMTGPSSDHTTGDGHYMYIESNGVFHGDTARLVSPHCSKSGPRCLQFWYHMYGTANTMGLSVYLLEDQRSQTLWSVTDDQGDRWHRARVEVVASGTFQVIFEGRRGSNNRSDVAVDDIFLHLGSCSALTEETIVTVRTTKPIQTPTLTSKLPKPTTESITSSERSNTTDSSAIVTSSAPSCPRHSHHSDCVPVCQPTCESIHSPPDCPQDLPCVGGCECDQGFLLKGRQCVPLKACICQDQKGHNHHFGESWLTDYCNQRCMCEERGGQGVINCTDNECSGNSVCYQEKTGQYRCRSTGFSKCIILGHRYRNFDNVEYKFKGKGTYVLFQTTNRSADLPDLYVEASNDHEEDGKSSEEDGEDDKDHRHDKSSEEDEDSFEEDSRNQLREMKIRVYNHTVEFKSKGRLVLDGEWTQTTPDIIKGGLKIVKRRPGIGLQTDFGLRVEFDGAHGAEITLPHTYKRRVQGLCGNLGGRRKKDLTKPDTRQDDNLDEYGESWREKTATPKLMPRHAPGN